MNRIYGALAVAALALAVSPAFAQIKIASVGPMTGQNAAFGEQLQRGAEMAVADINAAGGVNGQKVELQIGDDACDPKQATAVANKMVSDKVVFVAGHYCSGSSIPASDIYKEGQDPADHAGFDQHQADRRCRRQGQHHRVPHLRPRRRPGRDGRRLHHEEQQGQEGRDPSRQVALRQRRRRRDQEGPEQGRHDARRCTSPTTIPTRTSPR